MRPTAHGAARVAARAMGLRPGHNCSRPWQSDPVRPARQACRPALEHRRHCAAGPCYPMSVDALWPEARAAAGHSARYWRRQIVACLDPLSLAMSRLALLGLGLLFARREPHCLSAATECSRQRAARPSIPPALAQGAPRRLTLRWRRAWSGRREASSRLVGSRTTLKQPHFVACIIAVLPLPSCSPFSWLKRISTSSRHSLSIATIRAVWPLASRTPPSCSASSRAVSASLVLATRMSAVMP